MSTNKYTNTTITYIGSLLLSPDSLPLPLPLSLPLPFPLQLTTGRRKMISKLAMIIACNK
jgi:hypothetical protein